MCAVSAIGDDFRDRDWSTRPWINTAPTSGSWANVSRFEFDALKAEVEQLKRDLIEAKRYDEETGQPDCEMEDKVAFIKQIAEAVGVDLEEVFGK